MSGRKRSQIELERERQERLQLVSTLEETKGRLRGLSKQTQSVLDQTPKGIKDTFSKEVSEAIKWLERAEKEPQGMNFDMSSNTNAIKSSLTRLANAEAQGRKTLDKLSETFNEKASAMEKTLHSRLSQLESRYFGYRDSFDTWLGSDLLNAFDQSLSSAKQQLNNHDIRETQGALDDFEKRLDAKVATSQDMEQKHQKRLYVLKALRQVCSEMGFEETSPKYENDSKRGRIIYDVDTVDQGTVSFFLSLDGVTADSCIVDDNCLDEFDKLSDLLESEFGVKTKFSPEDGRPDGRLLQKGEMDLPEGTAIERSA